MRTLLARTPCAAIALGLAFLAAIATAQEPPRETKGMTARPPWPLANGDLSGRRASPLPGPAAGKVTARWQAPAGAGKNGPLGAAVVAADGTVVAPAGDGIRYFSPDLKQRAFVPTSHVATIQLIDDGTVLGSNWRAAYWCRPTGLTPIDTARVLGKANDHRLVQVPDGDLFVWDAHGLGALDASGQLKWKKAVENYGLGTMRVAVGPEGRVYVASAFSYQGEDDPTEYYGAIRAYAADGTQVWAHEKHDQDNLPSSTGYDLWLAVAPDGSVVEAETAVAVWDPSGRRVWSSGKGAWKALAIAPDGTIVLAHDTELCGVRPAAGGAAGAGAGTGSPASAQRIAALPEKHWPQCGAIDAAGTLYVSTGHDLFAVRPDGQILWRLGELPEIHALSLGDRCALVTAGKGELIRVE